MRTKSIKLGAHVLVYQKNFQSIIGVVVDKVGSRYAVRSDGDGLIYDVESINVDVITAKAAKAAKSSNRAGASKKSATSTLRSEYEAAKRAYHAKGRALAKATKRRAK